MIREFRIKMQRKIKLKNKNPMSLPPRKIKSTITLEIKATNMGEALQNSRMYLPGWEPIDWK